MRPSCDLETHKHYINTQPTTHEPRARPPRSPAAPRRKGGDDADSLFTTHNFTFHSDHTKSGYLDDIIRSPRAPSAVEAAARDEAGAVQADISLPLG